MVAAVGAHLYARANLGRPCSGAESVLLREGVDLDDDPVDLVPEVAAPGLPRRARLGDLFDRLQPLGVRVRAEPEAVQPGERLPLRGGGGAAVDADPVHVDRQRPLRGHGGVELAQRARGRISCVRRRLAASGDLRVVEAVEAGEREVDLAAHLENLGRLRSFVGCKSKRYRFQRAEVPGHVLAPEPVPARCTTHVGTAFVDERHGRAVDLRLEHIRHRVVGSEPLSYVVGPLRERLGGRDLLQRAHRRQVLDLAEAVRRRGADALRRGVRGDELGMLVFDRLQLVVERVVGGIGELGIVEDVVPVEVVLDEPPELPGPLRGGRRLRPRGHRAALPARGRRHPAPRPAASRRCGSRPTPTATANAPAAFAAWMSKGESPT